jgi:hypothetical protein
VLTIFWRTSVGRVEKVVGAMLSFFRLDARDDRCRWKGDG